MKKIFLILLTFSYVDSLMSQDFASTGTEWYYGYENPMSFDGQVSYKRYEVIKDTTLNSKPCKQINTNIIIYNSNDTTYFYDNIFDEFQILYIFNSQINDFWHIKVKDETNDIDTIIVTVDSLSTMNINGINLKVMNVTYSKLSEHQESDHYSKIVDKIGDLHKFFNWTSETDNFASDIGYFTGIRCYEDSVIGHYQNDSSIDCDFISTSIDKLNESDNFLIYPNPTNNNLYIEYELQANISYKIIDLNGEIVLSQKLIGKTIDIKNLTKGIYVLIISDSKEDFIINKFSVY